MNEIQRTKKAIVVPKMVAGWLMFGKLALSGRLLGSGMTIVPVLMVTHSHHVTCERG